MNGKEYTGWETASITRGIESVAGGFELSVSDKRTEHSPSWPIFEEDECAVALEGAPVITGYVDRRHVSFGVGQHTLSVSGRDKNGLLVDCSANPDLDKWEFKGLSILKFVQKIADPFGITVTLQSGLTDALLPAPPKKLSIDPGDTAFNAIETACRLAALLPISDGVGGLVLTRTGTARASTDLVEGENVLSASADFNAIGRFRTYRVLGQHKGTANFNGVSAASVKGTASDVDVSRANRTLIIRPEGNVTAEYAKKRAEWEATTRAARADAVSMTVQGWKQGNGQLWPVNVLVRVRSPRLGIDGDMLITEVTYTTGVDGTRTQITLKRPDAFKPEPTVKAVGTAWWKEIERGV